MLEKNTNLIIGKINSGKTRGILIPEVSRMIKNNENMFILDSKQEYYKTYAEELKKKGYQVKLFNLSDSTKTNGWNPLSLPYFYYKNGKKDKSIELIEKLALEIFKTDNPNSDPFWGNMASDYFTGLVLILFKEGKTEEINLGSIQMMISSEDKKIDDTTIMKKYLEKLEPIDNIYIATSSTVFAPSDTKGSILSVMKQKLNLFLMKEELLDALIIDDFKLQELQEKIAIFVIGKSSYNILSNILINQVIEVARENKIKFSFILDNFDTLPNLLELKDFIENATYYNFKINIAVKSKEEFLERYGKFIIDRFDKVVEVSDIQDMSQIGKYCSFPILEQKKHAYFKIEEII